MSATVTSEAVPRPVDEAARLAAVRRYDILDSPPDGAFDRIASLAARLFDVPVAIISVVDEDRIWFKSHYGIDAEQVERDPGLCASAILGEGTWVVTDASVDLRAMANPLVAGEFGLRFYAGRPLTTYDGHNLGTLCVIDQEPRELDQAGIELLTDLAALVMDEMELRRAAREAFSQAASIRAEVEELARALQASLLPPALPAIPHTPASAYYRPANHLLVGGDFYDAFPLDCGAWGVVIGDVCGKGSAAAALTSRARYSVRAAAIGAGGPSDLLRVVNQALLADAGPEEPFVTILFARVEPGPASTVIHFAAAGHPLPTLLRADGTVSCAGTPGSLLGVFPDVALTDTRVELEPGDTLVLTTDGVLDSGGPLEQAGLERILGTCRGLPVAAVVERIHRAIDAAQRDDIAILALSRAAPRA